MKSLQNIFSLQLKDLRKAKLPILKGYAVVICLLFAGNLYADSVSQAKRMHDRIAGIPPSEQTLQEMASLIDAGDDLGAAQIALESPYFYNVTLKNWITPWTNEEADVFAPLNDYTATVIGMIRDDIDFRELLSGDILYIANNSVNVPSYSVSNNNHYESLEAIGADLSLVLQATTQSATTGLPADATAGVMTTRAAAKSFFKDGTNRAMFRFTLINHMCRDLEPLKDTSLPPDRIRQDLSRSPGGDSRIFFNSCSGCHSGMDPLAQAFAYYEYEYNVEGDPDGQNGRLTYNNVGQIDPDTGSRVTRKHQINANNFEFGFIIEDDRWDNYWREGINQTLGWSEQLSGFGNGAKSMGEELANSQVFAQCQVTKVFENVCLRQPQDAADRSAIDEMTSHFVSNNYRVKDVFARSAAYCKGE
ncbi:hypothetical protein [Glaciecola petra]|uniref:DUF1585 domain-containing protein n=1 Tax=Glaciecola petra TaxID=3075602 RepID=A0ABU2ZQV5_9ALTE|nr:hypothetical protein [Aestuariibacter sp. P117]MDT0595018.1 hypothetical protein [Aestuariibacter sp. P117]